MTVADVAASTGATPQTTAKLLGDLERDRFVRKTKIPGTDQRTRITRSANHYCGTTWI
jgi:DNA-binding IclR family transcriptional regulator